MTTTLEKLSFALLCALLLGVGALAPIAQATEYHRFAGAIAWHGLPNAANVLSNLAFIAVGFWVLHLSDRVREPLRGSLDLFAIGLVLTGLGSAVYHWAPDNHSLVWDRLPMTLAFAGAIGAMAYQHVGLAAVRRWQNAWLYVGPVSVAVWSLGGDLRLYAVVQFGALALGLLWMLATALTSHPRATDALPWHWVWGGYALAKAFEQGDTWLWHVTGATVSGHPLKHIAAASGVLPLCWALNRMPKPS